MTIEKYKATDKSGCFAAQPVDGELSHYEITAFNGFRGNAILRDVLKKRTLRRGGHLYALFCTENSYIVARKQIAHERDFPWQDVAELVKKSV